MCWTHLPSLNIRTRVPWVLSCAQDYFIEEEALKQKHFAELDRTHDELLAFGREDPTLLTSVTSRFKAALEKVEADVRE